MALFHRRAKPEGDIPSSSMADIAFLLLIFFLVTTIFPKDQGLGLVLPNNATPVDVPAQNILQFVIGETGVVEVRRGDSRQSRPVSPDRVADIWREGFMEAPLLIAVVQTHPNAPYRYMIDVLDGLRSAGARRVSLQSLPR